MKSPRKREEILQRLIVSIDGPSGSGKTTTAQAVARRLNLRHLDTGAMYRAVTLKTIQQKIDPSDTNAIAKIARTSDIKFAGSDDAWQRVLLDGVDVSDAIRTMDVTKKVSRISAQPGVRRAMVERQRRLADLGGVVLEGRDIGSVVLPHADVKIYLDAAIPARAERRQRELVEKGTDKPIDDVRRDLEQRDHLDSTREVSPLRIPIGARVIDTTQLTIDGQTDAVVATANGVTDRLYKAATDRTAIHKLRRRPWVLGFAQNTIRFTMRLFWGIRIIRKSPYAYAENYIFACNHRSYADPPFVGSTIFRNVFFVAKAVLFRNPLLGRIIRMYNAIPIRKARFDRALMDTCLELLGAGNSILIFPEGTRIRGDHMGKALPGIGYLALRSGKPVVPIYTNGTDQLRGALLRRPHLTVIHGHPIRLTETDLEKLQETGHYRDYGEMVMHAIQALRDEYYPDDPRGTDPPSRSPQK